MNSVITEMSETNGIPRDWVLYDADCGFCTSIVRRLERPLARRGLATAPLQTSWVRARLALPEADLMSEMRVLTREGRVIGGADAVVFLAGEIGWGWPLRAIARLPGMMSLLRAGYRSVAARRRCVGACRVREPARGVGAKDRE